MTPGPMSVGKERPSPSHRPPPEAAMERPRGEGEPWKVLEFYSGIGGMRYSLMESGIRFEVVEAFDINDKANDVYEFNFGHRPCQGNIQSLTASDLDRYGAHAWLLSPPCQPYTRQGLRKESGDARASSFLKILSVVPFMLRPPHILFVENVVGFETSDTHKQMIDFFSESGFNSQEYILTPLQFGVPYSRPRYFCLAKRKPLSFLNPSFNNQLFWTFKPLQECWSKSHIDVEYSLENNMENQSLSCEPIDNFLELKSIYETLPNVVDSDCSSEVKEKVMFKQLLKDAVPPLDENLRAILQERASIYQHSENIDYNYLNAFRVPLDLIERWGNVMDIVYPHSKRCCCFTKSYYRYVKGTGSFLATFQLMDRNPSKGDVSSLKELGLRYFTPREVANLHSFPKDFKFPDHASLRQRYALLGNSLSVAVVGPLLQYLFSEPD